MSVFPPAPQSARRMSEDRSTMRPNALAWRPLLGLLLCLTALWLTFTTWSWPFVGDASYVHYVVFLMQHGLHPYRDIVDVTLPGAYLTEQAIMVTLGPGPLAWRLYDLLLMATAAAATLYLLASEDLLAGALASVLLFTLHAQDGVHMLGERDLEVGIALLVGLAKLAWIRRHPGAPKLLQTLAAAVAGALAAIAFSIKPTAALTILVLLGWMLWLRRRGAFPTSAIVAYCVGGVVSILYPSSFSGASSPWSPSCTCSMASSATTPRWTNAPSPTWSPTPSRLSCRWSACGCCCARRDATRS